HELKVKNINPHLVEAKDIFITKRSKPICNVPEISFGSMPNDGGNFLFTDEEKTEFIKQEPKSEKFFKPLISAYEFIHGQKRWCLWLKNANPSDLNEAKLVIERVENVRKLRAESRRQATQKLAAFPTLFGEDRQPQSSYVLIPRHSSENRKYIPMGFFDESLIVSDSCSFIPNAKLYHFGVLMSVMHMAWVKTIGGRIKSDYRYSNEIVYTNYPWPDNPTEKQVKAIEEKAQKVLAVRADFPKSSLAVLYKTTTIPPALVKAHNELDKAVDLAYRSQPFTSEASRMEFLFGLYEKYTADLFTKEKSKKKIR
ncbi:MAG TPA: methylase, partial [Treponemataceae bacterium]|nr:methylase [Treponemataceae bacterium]